MALRLRRGTDSDRLLITPLAGELLYVTDTGNLYVGDGTTAGGNQVGQLVDDETPQLGGNLDLNGNDITGTGNINISGTITATGSINLGDGDDDNINVGGEFTSGLVPNADNAHNLGAPTKRWQNLWVSGADIDGHADIGTTYTSLIDDTSTVAWNPVTSTFTGTFVGNTTGYHTGDVTGSVFAIDSTNILDAINGTLSVFTVTTQKVQTQLSDSLLIQTNSQPITIKGSDLRNEVTGGNTRLTQIRDYATGTAANTDTVSRVTFKTNDTTNGELNRWTDEVSVIARTILSGDPSEGTQNAANHFQIWNTGKVRVNTETAIGVQSEPDSNFDIYGIMKIAPLSSEPATAVTGMITVADGTGSGWDPANFSDSTGGIPYPVFYDGTTWQPMVPDPVTP